MSARATTLALARVEGRRLLRRPFLLAMVAIAGPPFAAPILVAGREACHDRSLVVPFVPFALATSVAVNLAALRARRDDAEDPSALRPTAALILGVVALGVIVATLAMLRDRPRPA